MLSRAAWSRRESEKTGPRKQYHHPTDKHLAKAKKLLADIRRLYGEGKGELIPTLPEGAGRKCGCFQFIRFGLCSDEEDCMNDDKAFQILRDAVDVKEAGDRIADATESPCGIAGTTAKQRAAPRAIGCGEIINRGEVMAAYRRDHPERMAGKEQQIADTPGNGGPIGNNDESAVEMDRTPRGPKERMKQRGT
jgi:hypothetical protein